MLFSQQSRRVLEVGPAPTCQRISARRHTALVEYEHTVDVITSPVLLNVVLARGALSHGESNVLLRPLRIDGVLIFELCAGVLLMPGHSVLEACLVSTFMASHHRIGLVCVYLADAANADATKAPAEVRVRLWGLGVGEFPVSVRAVSVSWW